MSDVANRQQGLPRDAILIAGLAFSVFGLTIVFTIGGTLLKRWTTLSAVQLGAGVSLPSVIVGYGFAAGSIRRRSLVGLALVFSWISFFHGGEISLLGGGGLLVCIGLLVSDGVREDRLGIGVHFIQSGALMVLTVAGISAYGIFRRPIPVSGIWALWGWSGIVLSVGGFILWMAGLTYDSPHLEVSSDSL